MTTLQEQIKLVAEARRKHWAARENLASMRVAWDIEHETERRALSEAEIILSTSEAVLRDLTLAAYAETGNKHPAPGVNVRLVVQLEYDPVLALEWSKKNLPVALKLDTKIFEKIAKATMLDFVMVSEIPQATISQDLAMAEQEAQHD